MILSDIRIHHVRNIQSAQLKLDPHLNVITGSNGSGKTSVLESLYILGCGHSFRHREVSSIIQHGNDSLTVFARSHSDETISVQKNNKPSTLVKINQQFCKAASELAAALPVQVVYQDIFQIIDAGPAVRRSLLDWGMFHVEHDYLNLLNQYKRALKQRNALLRQHAPIEHFTIWDEQLSELARKIDERRNKYFIKWECAFQKILKQLTDLSCKIKYYKGWDRREKSVSLSDTLAEHFQQDLQRQYTYYGPHQADILIEADVGRAKQTLSRGQQKMILIALKLSQAALLEKQCLYLFDDLSSELDDKHLNLLLEYLKNLDAQIIITSTSVKGFECLQATFFDMNEGLLSLSPVENIGNSTEHCASQNTAMELQS